VKAVHLKLILDNLDDLHISQVITLTMIFQVQSWSDEASLPRTQLAPGSPGRLLPALHVSRGSTHFQERKRQKRCLLLLELGK
jgi:hypothetical protein